MATSNGGFLHTDQPAPLPIILPPWLSNSAATSTIRPASPSVTLSLSPATIPPSPTTIPWLHPERATDNVPLGLRHLPSYTAAIPSAENPLISELMECCKELEEGQRALTAHQKEAAWRLGRLELQLESEKASRKREKLEDIEAKVKALREQEKVALYRIESEYREQLAGLRRDAEAKDQKLAEQWAAKHLRLTKFLEQMGCRPILSEPHGR